MTTSASTPAPATAMPSAPEPEKFRVVIPPEVAALLHEGDGDPEALEPAAIPDVVPPVVAAPAPVPALVPVPVVAASPAPAPAPADTDAKLKRAEEVWNRVEESVRAARGARQAGPAPSTALSDQEWEQFTKGAKDEIAKAEDFGQAAEEIFKRLRVYDTLRAEREKTARWTQKLEILEADARTRYPDYDQMLVEGALWGEGIPDQNGTIRDMALAKQIYADGNPPDAAYWVAVARAAQKQGKTLREFLAARGQVAPASPPAPAAPPAAPVVIPPEPASRVAAHPGEPGREPTAVEAARRATAETITTMADHSARPRGLKGLEPAGAPQNLWSFDQLNRLMDTNPDGFLALVGANPGLDQWFMNGGKAE